MPVLYCLVKTFVSASVVVAVVVVVVVGFQLEESEVAVHDDHSKNI